MITKPTIVFLFVTYFPYFSGFMAAIRRWKAIKTMDKQIICANNDPFIFLKLWNV